MVLSGCRGASVLQRLPAWCMSCPAGVVVAGKDLALLSFGSGCTPSMPPQDDGSGARWEHRDGQACHGPEPCGPRRRTAATLRSSRRRRPARSCEGGHQHLGAIRRGGAVVAREARRHVHVRGHSVEIELVALDVLHHEHDSLSSSAGSSRTRTAPSATSRAHSASSVARRSSPTSPVPARTSRCSRFLTTLLCSKDL
jgi:hypothetical protein